MGRVDDDRDECPYCIGAGSGRVGNGPSHPCEECGGTGVMVRPRLCDERDAARALADQAFRLLHPLADPDLEEWDQATVWKPDWFAQAQEFFLAYKKRGWK